MIDQLIENWPAVMANVWRIVQQYFEKQTEESLMDFYSCCVYFATKFSLL